MRRLLHSAGLALLLGWNAMPATAQERLTSAQPGGPIVHDMRQQPPLSPMGCGPGGCAGGDCGAAPAAAGQGQRWRPFQNCFHKMGSCCFVDANSPGCTSCYAEYIFQFGTCRQWFGEPCLPYPPRNGPPQYGFNSPAPYGTNGYNGAYGGCNGR